MIYASISFGLFESLGRCSSREL